MKRVWLSSLGLAALAFAITWLSGSGTGDPVPSVAERDRSSPRAQRERRDGTHHRSSEEYRNAWAAIAAKRLGRHERQRLQQEIFNAWAEVDLEAAIAAVFAEPWDDGSVRVLESQVMLDRCEDVWRLIEKDRFGPLGGALLLDAWAKVLGAKDPEVFLGYLPELKGLDLRNALRAMVQQVNRKEDAVKIWKAVVGRTDLDADERVLIGNSLGKLGGFLSPDDLRSTMRDGEGLPAEAAARALIQKLRGSDGEFDLAAEFEDAPEGLRSAMAFEWLADPFAPLDPTLAALDQLVANDQWDYLGRSETIRQMPNLASHMGVAKLAEWVADLPPREETTEMFHRGVEPFIRQDREAAWEWMNGLEDDTWRDRAFAEYSQQALNRFNDPEASRRALDQVRDPAFKATAEGWRKSWERRTGWSAP